MAMLAPFAMPLLAASAAVGAVGSIRSGNMQQAAADAEAQRMNAAADVTLRDATAQDEQFRMDARRRIGLQLAASAEAGAGLNADSLRESIYGVEMDSAAIRYGAMSRDQALRDQAGITRWQGRNAKTAGYLNAAASVLNAGSSYYGGRARIDAAKKGT